MRGRKLRDKSFSNDLLLTPFEDEDTRQGLLICFYACFLSLALFSFATQLPPTFPSECSLKRFLETRSKQDNYPGLELPPRRPRHPANSRLRYFVQYLSYLIFAFA